MFRVVLKAGFHCILKDIVGTGTGLWQSPYSVTSSSSLTSLNTYLKSCSSCLRVLCLSLFFEDHKGEREICMHAYIHTDEQTDGQTDMDKETESLFALHNWTCFEHRLCFWDLELENPSLLPVSKVSQLTSSCLAMGTSPKSQQWDNFSLHRIPEVAQHHQGYLAVRKSLSVDITCGSRRPQSSVRKSLSVDITCSSTTLPVLAVRKSSSVDMTCGS